MTDFWIFDRNDRLLYMRSDAESAVHTEETMTLTAQFPEDPNKPIDPGMRIAFEDLDGVFQCFEIRKPTHKQPDGYLTIDAEHIAIAELMDAIIEDRRPTGASPVQALSIVLEGTSWQVGTVIEGEQHSTMYYFKTAWECVGLIQDTWGVVIVPRIEVDRHGIIGRYLDIKTRRGTDRGVRLELDYNVESADITWDDLELYTALYGLGKPEQAGETAEGEPTYTRRITFADATWSLEDGDPVDKPLGQKWVEDPAATAVYGRSGRRRYGMVDFPDIEDPGELLRATWDALQHLKVPRMTVEAQVINLRSLGYEGQPLRLGDDVAVIIDPLGVEVKAAVTKMQRDLVAPERTRPTIGAVRTDILDVSRSISAAAAAGQQIAAANPSLLQGYIDTMVTRVLSTGTKMDTYKDGGLIFVSSDGQSAVLITGRGILLSHSKVDGEWQWTTAFDGTGGNASTLNVGDLNAALIRIMGSEGTFWDNNYIQITSAENPAYIMRYGRYDGINSGMAFSRDGGMTWSTAIGFDGAHFGDTIAGFDIGTDGLTNGNLIQLLSSKAYFKLGGMTMDGGDHPYFTFEYDGIKAVHIGEGSMEVNQTLQVNGNVMFTALPPTDNPPNLYVDLNGKLYRSHWQPGSSGGGDGGDTGAYVNVTLSNYSASPNERVSITASVVGGTGTNYTYEFLINGVSSGTQTSSSSTYSMTPLVTGVYVVNVTATLSGGGTAHGQSAPCTVGGSGGGLYVVVNAGQSNASVGDLVTWGAQAHNAMGSVSWGYDIYSPTGLYRSGSSNFASVTVNTAGNWYAVFTANDTGSGNIVSGTGGNISVSSGSAGHPTSGKTTGSNVRIRNSPNANSSIGATIGTSGTQVEIMGPLVADSQGGSTPWWPVRWMYEGDYHNGYIRSDYLSPNY